MTPIIAGPRNGEQANLGLTKTCTRVSFPGGPAAVIRGAGRGHRERVEPFDTTGALGTGRVPRVESSGAASARI
jgi:hypothetical protein